jgi:hypothetical protein
MKAITQNNETFKLTGERGDFYICENSKGKAKMFLKSDVEIIEISEMPKMKKYKSHEVSGKSAIASAIRHEKMVSFALKNEHTFNY